VNVLFLTLLACSKAPEAECSAELACPFGEVCVEGACQAQSCVTSEQCGIEQYCKEGSCADGCAADTDCMFGDVCDADTRTCTVGECSDTRTDCGFGEFCSPSGDCYEAGGNYCKPCEADGDCGAGNYCLAGYCGVACDNDLDCPAGYDCLPLGDVSGNIITYQCWTSCWLYEGSE